MLDVYKFGLELVSSYIPALNTMSNLALLFSESNEKGRAKTMYKRALSEFATVWEPSARCRELQRQLEALELTPSEMGILNVQSTQTRVRESKSLREVWDGIRQRMMLFSKISSLQVIHAFRCHRI